MKTLHLVCVFGVLIGGLLLRFGMSRSVFVVQTLANRFEVSTAASGAQRWTEGVHALHIGEDPYDSGTVHNIPLILRSMAYLFTEDDISRVSAILFPVSGVPAGPVPLKVVGFFGFFDMLSALCAFFIALSVQRVSPPKSVLASSQWFPLCVVALFMFNPLSIVECVAMSSDVINISLVLASVAAACWNLAFTSAVFLALVSTAALYPVILILPLSVLIWYAPFVYKEKKEFEDAFLDRLVRTVLFMVTSVVGCMATIYTCAVIEEGRAGWIREVLYFLFFAPDHTPNIGLWWDLLLEVFPQFTHLFMYVLQILYFAAYPVVASLRLTRMPMVSVWILCASWAILTPYPSLSHVALQMTLYSIVVATYLHGTFFKTHELKLLRNVVLVAAVLVVLMANATRGWLYTGTGNVNFYFAGVLVLQATQTYWVANTLESLLRDEYVLRHPHNKRGKQHQKNE